MSVCLTVIQPDTGGSLKEIVMRIFVPSEDGPYVGSMRLVPYQPGLVCEHALRDASHAVISDPVQTASPTRHLLPESVEVFAVCEMSIAE